MKNTMDNYITQYGRNKQSLYMGMVKEFKLDKYCKGFLDYSGKITFENDKAIVEMCDASCEEVSGWDVYDKSKMNEDYQPAYESWETSGEINTEEKREVSAKKMVVEVMRLTDDEVFITGLYNFAIAMARV